MRPYASRYACQCVGVFLQCSHARQLTHVRFMRMDMYMYTSLTNACRHIQARDTCATNALHTRHIRGRMQTWPNWASWSILLSVPSTANSLNKLPLPICAHKQMRMFIFSHCPRGLPATSAGFRTCSHSLRPDKTHTHTHTHTHTPLATILLATISPCFRCRAQPPSQTPRPPAHAFHHRVTQRPTTQLPDLTRSVSIYLITL